MITHNRTKELIEILGVEDFSQLFEIFMQTWQTEAEKLYRNSERRKALHKLKGSCYAVGLDLIGKHIETVEEMLEHGAESTAREHFPLIIKEIETSQESVKMLIVQLS
ncbi:Hpt domain-containing protein [Thiomicrorhabdus sp. 6S2-11]|jgi:hypothetical protein|uniref:Hpt domain-containing protein n=1 Tax=Thiomicrorhabdus marina TaxID=2818442 RepID=A0ABS3Q823_9GAMM|nr:Hpt domain-containing protein [Thiomicrorhabdus marina]MBO1928223.1 Hpt domain-containing protein [Thiomicrorhabdus marina]